MDKKNFMARRNAEAKKEFADFQPIDERAEIKETVAQEPVEPPKETASQEPPQAEQEQKQEREQEQLLIVPTVERKRERAPIEYADFRGLPEPERTRLRIDYILRRRDLTNAFRVGAALIVNACYGCDPNTPVKINLSSILDEFPSRVKVQVVKRLEEIGLAKKMLNNDRKSGQIVQLLF